jgi:DNA-directed RNA polymerase subunit F
MVDYELIEEKFVAAAKVKEVLEQRKELSYEQKLALEHAKEVARLSPKQAEQLIQELKALEMRKLKDEIIVKLVNLLPRDVEDLKVLLLGTKVTFKTEELEKIIEILKKYEVRK